MTGGEWAYFGTVKTDFNCNKKYRSGFEYALNLSWAINPAPVQQGLFYSRKLNDALRL